MNEDFSEIFSKFQDILKEKDINLSDFTSKPNTPSENSDFSIDMETILKIKDIISKLNQNKDCPRNILLHSLKPYLQIDKQEKLEQYIKIANLLTILENQNIGFNFFDTNKKGYDYILIITLFLLII